MSAIQRFHLLGIGGAGVSVVAQLLQAQGAIVSGSDSQESPVLERLRGAGIQAFSGHNPSQVPVDAVVVVSSAIRPDNPELVLAKARGQQIIHRSEALALAAIGSRFVAIAGAHGKTTTSAMLAVGLLKCGLDPSYAIGGVILSQGTGAHLGQDDIFVAEADESDGSFLNYHPQVAVVTNVEVDHLDHYGSVAAFEQIFVDFVQKIIPGGTLICCAEDPGAAKLATQARKQFPGLRVWTYGRSLGNDIPTVAVGPIVGTATSVEATIAFGEDEPCRLQLCVSGEHNLLNAVGAWTAGVALGVDQLEMAAGLGEFGGTGRRFELRGQVGGRRLFVDYAHHPTEVAALLSQARTVAGDGKVVAVFQPHLFSRTVAFADRFARALSLADRVILADIYGAREDPQPGITSDIIFSRMAVGEGSAYLEGATLSDVAVAGARLTGEGDLCLLIGAGDIDQGASSVLRFWRSL